MTYVIWAKTENELKKKIKAVNEINGMTFKWHKCNKSEHKEYAKQFGFSEDGFAVSAYRKDD